MTEWYIQPLSPAEIRANIKYALWREEDDKMLYEQLKFLAEEMKNHL